MKPKHCCRENCVHFGEKIKFKCICCQWFTRSDNFQKKDQQK